MKIVFLLSLMIAMITTTVIGCLIIFDVFSLQQGMDFGVKALSAIALLCGASVIFSLFIRNKKSSD